MRGQYSRRDILRTGGLAGTALLAGCSSGDDGAQNLDTTTATSTDTATAETTTGAGDDGQGVGGYSFEDPNNETVFSFREGVYGQTDQVNAKGVFGYNDATATSGFNTGVLGRSESDSPNAAGVWAYNAGTGPAMVSNGPMEIRDAAGTRPSTLTMSADTTQRTAGPIAKGFITADATVKNAVNVASATWNSSATQYEIGISGESIYYPEYATSVSPATAVAYSATSVSGDLVVEFADGNQHEFQFVLHELPSGTVTTNTTTTTASTTDTDTGAGPR